MPKTYDAGNGRRVTVPESENPDDLHCDHADGLCLLSIGAPCDAPTEVELLVRRLIRIER